jgi:Sugar kinases, ribokinase family
VTTSDDSAPSATAAGYAVVAGEALVDLIEFDLDGQAAFRPMVGGAPLNVAAGLARLGISVHLVTSISSDALGQRIWDLLTQMGVDHKACRRVDVPTTLAVTSLRNAVPEFTFYGDPPSFAQVDPSDLDADLVAGATTLYCGSIALMYPAPRELAAAAWATPGPRRILDPNVRPRLLRDRAGLRRTIEEFASIADMVKLSEPDARVLFDLDPPAVARHLRATGARAVVVTLGPNGAYADTEDGTMTVPAPPVRAIDTTGAGDACVAALMYRLHNQGWPTDVEAWRDLVGFATTAASLACEIPGGATAMPTVEAIQARHAHR